MSTWLVSAVTVAYAGVAIDQFLKGQFPMALVWTGYAIANVGMVWGLK